MEVNNVWLLVTCSYCTHKDEYEYNIGKHTTERTIYVDMSTECWYEIFKWKKIGFLLLLRTVITIS